MQTINLAPKRSKLLILFYILCLMVAGLGETMFFHDYTKVVTVGAVIAAILVLLVSGDLEKMDRIFGFWGLYIMLLVGILLWSACIWIVQLEDFFYMVRGISKLVFQGINIFVVVSAVYLFREKAIHYTFYGIALSNTLIVILNFLHFGWQNAYETFVVFIQTMGTATGFMKQLEIHDMTFTYGFFLLYFIFFDNSAKQKRILYILICCVFILIGLKRIELVGILLASLLGILLIKPAAKQQYKIMRGCSIACVFFCFVYIVSIRYGIFDQIMTYFHIDTMGRQNLYHFISQYYTMGPDFFGYGFGFISELLRDLKDANIEGISGLLAIHNDILVQYIELGFIGFGLWAWYVFSFQFQWIYKGFGVKTAKLFLLCMIYILTTYTTDNTIFYYWTSLVLRLIPMAYAFRNNVEEEMAQEMHTLSYHWSMYRKK